jgi:hypothetical protein
VTQRQPVARAPAWWQWLWCGENGEKKVLAAAGQNQNSMVASGSAKTALRQLRAPQIRGRCHN